MLMPYDLGDWLPEDHLARFIVDIVEKLKFNRIYLKYKGVGTTAYGHRMLLSLLFYGYSTGVFSSRKIECSTCDSVTLRFIAGNHHPGHDTISSFRKRFFPEIKTWFTLSGMAVMLYSQPVNGASISYKMKLPVDVKTVTVHVVVKSTLAFINLEGHRYKVGFNGGGEKVVNFNSDLNEKPENIYSIFFPTVARRVVEKKVEMNLPVSADGMQELTLTPLDPGIVFEKIVVDFGGYKKSYLFGNESPGKR